MTKGKFSVVVAIGAFAISSCATQMDWLVTGASRADGVVSLSYEHNEFQRPQLNEAQATQIATQKCAAWGYKGAEPLGSQRTDCLSYRGFGSCGSRRVTVEYQCIGSPAQEKSKVAD